MHRINRSNRKFNRSQRRRYQDSDDDVVNIEWGKPLNQIAHEILQQISRKDNLPKNQLLAYLNCFTKYCLKRSRDQSSLNESLPNEQSLSNFENDNHENGVGLEALSDNEVLCCLRHSLFHDAAEVRAASLRAIRYYVQSKKALHCLLELNLQHLIARSLDIVLENRIERVQALRLIRHILSIDPNIFPLALGRCLCAIAGDNSLEKDMLLRACWATIAELTTVNAIVSARAGCVSVMVKCAMNSAIGFTSNSCSGDLLGRDVIRDRGQTNNAMLTGGMMTSLTLPHTNIAISEAILSSFLHLYNWPDTRRLLQPKGSDLFYFISPFTDTYSFLHASNAARNNNPFNLDLLDQLEEQQQAVEQKETKPFQTGHNRQVNKQQQQQQQQQYANYEFRTLRYLACKNALLSILRSWPGMFFMCRTVIDPESRIILDRSDGKDNLWDYSEIYRQTGEQTMRSLLDSLRFFGIPEEVMPTKVTQMVSGIGKAMNTNCEHTSSYFTTTSYDSLNPLESLISIFHLPYPEVHRHLLELIYELFGMKPPDWTENFDEALRCVYFTLVSRRIKHHKTNSPTSFESTYNTTQSKSYFPEEWQLYDGFVAKEAEQILPCLSNSRLNFITNYYALLLQSLVEFGLLESLVSVILDSTDKAAVNLTTILLGELLHLSGKYLPASSYAHRCQSLPTLVAASISDCKTRRNRALMAITHLNQIHELKKRGPKPASLYLEQQLYFCQASSTAKPRRMSQSQNKNNDESVISLIKNSLVLKRNNFKDWNWDIITDVLKHPGESFRKLEDKENHRVFIRRLLDFFRPSRRLFSLVSKNSSLGGFDLMSPPNQNPGVRSEPIYVDNPRLLCVAAIHFVDFLLDAEESRATEFIEEFLYDLDMSMKSIATKSPSSEEILLPSRLLSTLSHHYFLLLGRFTHSPGGRRWLEKTHIYQYLLDLISLATNDVYIKLIVSSLDYNEAILSRNILSKVLTSTPESSRLYATQYLRVLLRARALNFSQWAIDFLVVQLYDRCPAVSLTAMDILDEACADDDICLEKVISHRPAILHLGDIGITFLTRFVAHPVGLNYLKESNMLENELSRWRMHFTARYVRMVEDSLNECFSCHQRSDYGTFGRRSDRRHFPNPKRVSTTTFVPPHLYGQLVQTEEGFQILRDKLIVPPLIMVLKDNIDELIAPENCTAQQHCTVHPNEANVLRMKAALWSIGHISTSERGLEYAMQREEPILLWLITLTQRCPVLSLRATCFYVLCLIASTRKGAQLLSEFGWTAIQHSHDEIFPINQQEYDSFYFNGRPRFMSDPEKVNQPRSAIVSIPSTSFFAPTEDLEQQTATTRHYSQSSSRSSSSSYLSMQVPGQPYSQNNRPRLDSKLGDKSEEHKLSFTLSSSSSSTSIYSNTSSIGCLISTNVVSTTTYNRPRSSSDCVPTITSSVDKNASATSKMVDSKLHSKPEYQDSGILEQASHMNDSSLKQQSVKVETSHVSASPLRNRKISAPCFAVTTESNRENRSDSNDSSRTTNTALYSSGTGSRSTSFAEYSTSSSGSNVIDPPKLDRNVSFSPDTTPLHSDLQSTNTVLPKETNGKTYHKFERALSNRQMSLLVQNDDPYPSAVDAHGYAQLRAIQKRRVQSLSGNMFFSGIANSNSIIDQYNLVSDQSSNKSSKLLSRPHSNSLRSDEMPEILITDLNANSSNSGRQRKVSRTSLPPTSPIDGDLKRLLRIPSANSVDDSSQHSNLSKSFNRSFSRISKGSLQSVESVGTLGMDELSLGDSISMNGARTTKDHFMCLCLPDSLSFIFHVEEESSSNSKNKRVQFSNESEHYQMESNPEPSHVCKPKRKTSTVTRPCISLLKATERKENSNEGFELHNNERCMACCLKSSKCRQLEQINARSPQHSPSKLHESEKEVEHKLNPLESSDKLQDNVKLLSPNPGFASSSIAPHILHRKEVLRLVANLSAAMYAKQSEQGLLSFKQRFPSVFEDFCLYSEVCLQMESCNFRATARRFLHELFLDVNLDQLYKDTDAIFKQRACKLAGNNKLAVPDTS